MTSTTATRTSATRPPTTRPPAPRQTSDRAAAPAGPPDEHRHRSTGTPGQPGPLHTRLRLTGRGQLLLLLLLVVLVLGAFAMGRVASSQAMVPSDAAPVPAQVTVQQGDTLWSIARRVAPQRDPRDVVAQIRRLNHLPSAVVQAGRQLLLPVAV